MEWIIDALNAANQRVKELQPTERQIKEAIDILQDYMGAENIRLHPQYGMVVLMLKSAQNELRGYNDLLDKSD